MEKLSRPFSFHPLVFPDLAQLQREIRPQEHPRVDHTRPALSAFRPGSHLEPHRSRAERWVVQRPPALFVFHLCSHREPHP